MRQARICGHVWAGVRLQVLQNSGSRMFLLRVELCQREIANDEIREEDESIESAAI